MLRHRLEYLLARSVLGALERMPRKMARACGAFTALLIYALIPKWRRVAHRNLQMAMPEGSAGERQKLVRGVYRSIGRMLAEFALFPRYNPDNISSVVVYDGFANWAEARERGCGVLFLTAHLGAWELSAFAQSVYGHPLNVVIRALDNPYLNDLVNRRRTMAGNRIIEKRDFARGILGALHNNESVGILLDQNSSLQEGVFVDFFGMKACTSAGLARLALKTGAAVVPGFAFWDEAAGRYCLHFDPPLDLVRTGDMQNDVVANTQLFTSAIERHVREHPSQWLWIHRRWKTRPPGEPPLY